MFAPVNWSVSAPGPPSSVSLWSPGFQRNVSGPAPRFLERAVHYNGLSPKLAKRLEARSRELAMEALKTANREANRALAKDKGGDARWNFGIYIYCEDVDDATDGSGGGGPA